VESEVSQIPSVVQTADFHDRADLRSVPFATIDPETARDFDDAVALEELPRGGHRLWVAVADVSHYLREGTALDHEAQARGVSVYLPNRAIPMLPEALSGHLCSLVPGVDRLAMVVRIDYDRGLAITEVDFCAAVIHSHGRLDYPGVAAALAGDVRGKRKHYEPFLPSLRTMDALARKLRQRRQERGALDLDLPQVVVELDHDDPALVRDVRRARRDPGERHAYAMIEEFMLAANEAVGDSFRDRNEDTAWRVHEVPDQEKLASFAVLAERYGIKFDPVEAGTPLGLAAVLKRLRGHPAEKPLSFLLLRALKQATYDVVNVGHFGLASPAYCTSPRPFAGTPTSSCTACSSTGWPAWANPRVAFRPWPPPTYPPARSCNGHPRTPRSASARPWKSSARSWISTAPSSCASASATSWKAPSPGHLVRRVRGHGRALRRGLGAHRLLGAR